MASLGSMQDTGCLGLVHWDDPERWYGEGGRRGVQDLGTCVHPWRIHVDVWQNQHSIVKQNKVCTKVGNISPVKKVGKKKNKILSQFGGWTQGKQDT